MEGRVREGRGMGEWEGRSVKGGEWGRGRGKGEGEVLHTDCAMEIG